MMVFVGLGSAALLAALLVRRGKSATLTRRFLILIFGAELRHQVGGPSSTETLRMPGEFATDNEQFRP